VPANPERNGPSSQANEQPEVSVPANPENSRTTNSENNGPSSPANEKPEVSVPANPENNGPSSPANEQPEVSIPSNPENNGTTNSEKNWPSSPPNEQPEVSVPANPENNGPSSPANEQPEVSLPANPENSGATNSGNNGPSSPANEQPEVSTSANPENNGSSSPVNEQPEASIPTNPENNGATNSENNRPSSPAKEQPEVSVPANPENNGPTSPSNEQPEVSVSSNFDHRFSSSPKIELEPSVSSVVEPERSISVGVETSTSIPSGLTSCKITQSGWEYKGQLNVTINGYTCKAWANHVPRKGWFRKKGAFPDGNDEDAKNYCRNPDRDKQGPWCYTSDSGTDFDYCKVDYCGDSEHPQISEEPSHPEATVNPVKETTRSNLRKCPTANFLGITQALSLNLLHELNLSFNLTVSMRSRMLNTCLLGRLQILSLRIKVAAGLSLTLTDLPDIKLQFKATLEITNFIEANFTFLGRRPIDNAAQYCDSDKYVYTLVGDNWLTQ
jgi:hypothetical protein